MNNSNSSKVTLIGAGPGAVDLITVAGVKALRNSKVVFYDALVNTEILKWCPKAIKIFVGKRKGYKTFEQSEINQLLVANAYEYGNVVRLKGGDPFIFGRGTEEIDFVHSFGIETEVIPGVSSATSASTSQGIALTERNVSTGFWVITGTTKNNNLASDIKLAAKSNSTVVILMGMSKLSLIVAIFKSAGKRNEAVAIVEKAYTKNQKQVFGCIKNIEEMVLLNKIKNPAVILIGKVVVNGLKRNPNSINKYKLKCI